MKTIYPWIRHYSLSLHKLSKIALQFVLNYEEGAENNVLHGDKNSEIFLSEIIGAQPIKGRHINMESLYEYGSRTGFWRIYNEFINRNLPLTIFGVGLALEKNTEVCDAIKNSNFEWRRCADRNFS